MINAIIQIEIVRKAKHCDMAIYLLEAYTHIPPDSVHVYAQRVSNMYIYIYTYINLYKPI